MRGSQTNKHAHKPINVANQAHMK